MFGLGAPELIIILLIVLLIFGGSKLPQLARSLGQAQKEFKDGMAEGHKPESDAGTDKSPDASKDTSTGESDSK